MTRHFLGPPGWFYACWLLHAVNIRRRDLTAFPRARMCRLGGGAKIESYAIYMKNFTRRRALQAVDLNSISNLYLVSLQPYFIELSMARGGVDTGNVRGVGV